MKIGSKCHFDFCWHCGIDYKLILRQGNEVHKSECPHYRRGPGSLYRALAPTPNANRIAANVEPRGQDLTAGVANGRERTRIFAPFRGTQTPDVRRPTGEPRNAQPDRERVQRAGTPVTGWRRLLGYRNSGAAREDAGPAEMTAGTQIFIYLFGLLVVVLAQMIREVLS